MIEGFLISIIIGLIIERFFYARDMNRQVSDCMKALLSRNVVEFVDAKMQEQKKPSKELPPDAVPMNEVSDEEFINALNREVEDKS